MGVNGGGDVVWHRLDFGRFCRILSEQTIIKAGLCIRTSQLISVGATALDSSRDCRLVGDGCEVT